jgi:hypothetical protein
MPWVPTTREQLVELMSDALGRADDSVKNAWERIRIEPEKWRCSPWGDKGGGFLVPVDVEGLTSGVTAIAAGWSHACAVVNGGGTRCWGDNSYGELGNNSTMGSLVPVQVR